MPLLTEIELGNFDEDWLYTIGQISDTGGDLAFIVQIFRVGRVQPVLRSRFYKSLEQVREAIPALFEQARREQDGD